MVTGVDADSPLVSVIVASWSDEAALIRCLSSLEPQVQGMEVLVASVLESEVLDRLTARFPFVRVFQCSKDATVFSLRAHGVVQARGQIIALTEDHCTVSPEWIKSLISAYQTGHCIVGGCVENGLSRTVYDWALYFCEYGMLMPPLSNGGATLLSGVNVAYAREPLSKCRMIWHSTFHENEVHDALQSLGYRLYRVEDAWVLSHLTMTLGQAMAHLFKGGMHFGSYQIARTSYPVRLFRILAVPVIPMILFGRIACSVATRRLGRLVFILLGLPYILCLLAAWSLGEAIGYLAPAVRADTSS
jgi:glycosyltransferase involved in cell wall biosynthesis